MICCDTCPYNPTCEERDNYLKDIFALDDDTEIDWQHDGYLWHDDKWAPQ